MKKLLLAISFLLIGFSGSAAAGAILSAESAVINSGGSGFGSINDTFNQNGLNTGYVSGVDDFDAYVAGDPQHNYVFVGNEWFSDEGIGSASVTYNLGFVSAIDSIAWWAEDASGVGMLDIFVSTNGVDFSAVSLGLAPTDNLINFDYGADIFAFAAIDAQFIRFDMSACPQNAGEFDSCAVGEVAFREADATGAPEASSIMLLGLGLFGLGFTRKNKVS